MATFTFPDQLLINDTALEFTLLVTDANGLTATDTVLVTVSVVNDAPTADAGPDQRAAVARS